MNPSEMVAALEGVACGGGISPADAAEIAAYLASREAGILPHGVQQGVNDVRAFHEKHKFTINKPMATLPITDAAKDNAAKLKLIGHQLTWMAAHLEQIAKARFDDRVLRCHLMLEELGEAIIGISTRNETEALDGLADLLYVVFGTAVAFDLPLAEAFREVQRSNMTKATRAAGDLRLRDKGASYEPPNLGKIMSDHAAGRTAQ